MKCKDCNSMCKYRSSDGEKECFYSQPQPDTSELKTYNQVDEDKHWQGVRERAAIAAMQAILSNTGNKVYQSSLDIISKNAVTIADALVKQLKGE